MEYQPLNNQKEAQVYYPTNLVGVPETPQSYYPTNVNPQELYLPQQYQPNYPPIYQQQTIVSDSTFVPVDLELETRKRDENNSMLMLLLGFFFGLLWIANFLVVG